MSEEVYKRLCETMAARGGRYPGMDIPEFYDVARELFTPEEAAASAAMPRKPFPASALAQALGKDQGSVSALLETMADKGLCISVVRDGGRLYVGVPFVPGIFEFQFMRGTSTDRDIRLAHLIRRYEHAVDAMRPPRITFPENRVITVEKTIDTGSTVHTYDQVSSYIDQYDDMSVTACFCRHQGKLVDEKLDCGKPVDVCMQFGAGAQFVIERGIGRRISKQDARDTLRRAEEAGLVHVSRNVQQGVDFICNCCACHCMLLKTALNQPKPGKALFSGFQPLVDSERCVACGACVERCPAKALALDGDVPELDLDRCFGCGACATGCPSDAIAMVERKVAPAPPVDRKALAQAMAEHP
jgi:Pyruvate/2-oxoacid:ferredoxin oxidoreductase delta subunit